MSHLKFQLFSEISVLTLKLIYLKVFVAIGVLHFVVEFVDTLYFKTQIDYLVLFLVNFYYQIVLASIVDQFFFYLF